MAVRSATRLSKRNRLQSGTIRTLLVCAAVIVAALLVRGRPSAPVEQVVPAPIVAQFDAVNVPVPAEWVPAGTKVRDIKLKMVAFPKHQIPSGALTELAAVQESVTVTPLPANLPLFKENLSLSAGGSNPVLERIPAGMRAMTIRVDATSAVEGWAGSGSIVDVLLVEKEKTSVIAEKVKVLSAERSVSPVEGSSSPSVPTTVTILVTQEQCLAINTAIPLGRIAFALRSMKDEESWRDRSYTPERLKGGATPVRRRRVLGHAESGGESYVLLDDERRWEKETKLDPAPVAEPVR